MGAISQLRPAGFGITRNDLLNEIQRLRGALSVAMATIQGLERGQRLESGTVLEKLREVLIETRRFALPSRKR